VFIFFFLFVVFFIFEAKNDSSEKEIQPALHNFKLDFVTLLSFFNPPRRRTKKKKEEREQLTRQKKKKRKTLADFMEKQRIRFFFIFGVFCVSRCS